MDVYEYLEHGLHDKELCLPYCFDCRQELGNDARRLLSLSLDKILRVLANLDCREEI